MIVKDKYSPLIIKLLVIILVGIIVSYLIGFSFKLLLLKIRSNLELRFYKFFMNNSKF
jgi:hypothetical protein